MEHDTGVPAGPGPDAVGDVISSGPDGRDPHRRPRWLLAVAGGAAVLVVGAGAAAWAASTGHADSGSGATLAAAAPAPSAGPGQRELRDAPGGPGRYGPDGLRGALHGRVTVPERALGGVTGFRDVLVQRGTVSAVSATSLTVKSADGFTATYRITPSTQFPGSATSAAGLRTGQAVAVVAGTDSTALQVRDAMTPPTVRHDHRGLLGPEGGTPPSGAPGSGGSDSGSGTAPAHPSGHLPMSAPGAGPLGGAAA